MATRQKLSLTKPGAPPTAWTVRTDKALEAILDALSVGCTRRAAAARGGISEATLIRWEDDDENVANLIRQAADLCEARMTQLLTAGADNDPRWALEWLKRRRKDDYGDAFIAELRDKTDEQLHAIVNDPAKSSAEGAGAATPESGESGPAKTTIVVVYREDHTTTAPARGTAGDQGRSDTV